MHARLTSRAALAAILVLTSGVYAVAVGAPQAQAAAGSDNCGSGSSGGSSGGGGSVAGGTVTMWTQLTKFSQGVLCQGGSTSAAADPDWQPPQCWWAPEYSPQELANAIGSLDTNGGSAIDTYTQLTDEYAAGGTGAAYKANYKTTDPPPWERFNVPPATPAGEWWGLVWSDDITKQGIDDCTTIDNNHFPEDWYWVTPVTGAPDPGDAPTLDPQELAEYIAGLVKLSPVQVQTSPGLNHATVGLSDWLWADGAGNTTIAPVNICTQRQYGNICVTLSAWAEKLSISSPGATIFSDCNLQAGTTEIGTPYTSGNGNPPCGLTFNQAGPASVTIGTTWKVEITWAGGDLILNPQPLYQTLNAQVQAIQAVNGGSPSPSPTG